MNQLILRDRNGVDYEVKDPQRFSSNVFKAQGECTSFHEEEGHYFVSDDGLGEKIRNFLSKNSQKVQ